MWILVRRHFKDTNSVVQCTGVRNLSQLLQQSLDFVHFDFVGVHQQTVVFQIRFHFESLVVLLFFRFAIPISAVAVPRVVVFLWRRRHEGSDGAGHVFGIQSPQGDHFKGTTGLVETFNQSCDGQMIGQTGPRQNGLLVVVHFQDGAWIHVAQFLQQIDQRLWVYSFHTIDLHAIKVLQQRIARFNGHADLLNRFVDDCHLIGCRLHQNHVFSLVKHQPGLGRFFAAAPAALGSAAAADFLHLLLHLTHH